MFSVLLFFYMGLPFNFIGSSMPESGGVPILCDGMKGDTGLYCRPAIAAPPIPVQLRLYEIELEND